MLHCGRYCFILTKTNKKIRYYEGGSKSKRDRRNHKRGADEALLICIQILATGTHDFWMQGPKTGDGNFGWTLRQQRPRWLSTCVGRARCEALFLVFPHLLLQTAVTVKDNVHFVVEETEAWRGEVPAPASSVKGGRAGLSVPTMQVTRFSCCHNGLPCVLGLIDLFPVC